MAKNCGYQNCNSEVRLHSPRGGSRREGRDGGLLYFCGCRVQDGRRTNSRWVLGDVSDCARGKRTPCSLSTCGAQLRKLLWSCSGKLVRILQHSTRCALCLPHCWYSTIACINEAQRLSLGVMRTVVAGNVLDLCGCRGGDCVLLLLTGHQMLRF